MKAKVALYIANKRIGEPITDYTLNAPLDFFLKTLGNKTFYPILEDDF